MSTPGLRASAGALLARDLRLVWRRRGDALQPALFALLVVVLFALAAGGEREALAKHAAAVLWLAVLLAGLLALDSLFRGDAEDGSLEQWLLAPVPLSWLVLVRVFGHWLTTSLPLLVAAPFLGELLFLPRAQLPVLMLSLDTLFRGDAEDGSLDQWLLAPVPLSWLVAVRVFSHWLTTAVPVIVVTPLLGELLHLPRAQLPVLMVSLLLGTPILSLIGAVVAALTVGMRRAGILVALLALPLYVPVLVFGAGAVAASAQGLDGSGALLLLGAGLVLSLVLAPPVTAAALRIAHT